MKILYNINMGIVKEYFSIPNFITSLRIAMVPLFGYLLYISDIKNASILFLIMAVSDFLDGFIARKFNQISKIGKYLDPLADKLVILTTIFIGGFFTVGYSISFYFASIIFIKEVYLIVGIIVIFILRREIRVHTIFMGKITMFFEYLTVVIFLVSYYIRPLEIMLNILYITTALLAFLSMVLYTIRN